MWLYRNVRLHRLPHCLYAKASGHDDVLSLLLNHLNQEGVGIEDPRGDTALDQLACYADEAYVEIPVSKTRPKDLALIKTDRRTALSYRMAAGIQNVEECETIMSIDS